MGPSLQRPDPEAPRTIRAEGRHSVLLERVAGTGTARFPPSTVTAVEYGEPVRGGGFHRAIDGRRERRLRFASMSAYHIVSDNAELWVRDGRFVGTPQDGADELTHAFAIAGLVDCHSHSTLDVSARGLTLGSAEVVAANITDYQAAGVTAIRDAGGVSMAAVDARDPRVIAAGRFIAPRGRYLAEWTLPTEPEELVETARGQVAAGAAWVKIVDDWFAPGTGRIEQHYDTPTLREAVEAVHAGWSSGRDALHGHRIGASRIGRRDRFDRAPECDLEAAQIERMAASGTAWCPTITMISAFMATQDVPDPDFGARARRFYAEDLHELLPLAAALGVTILAGSDTIPPAEFWREIADLA